MAHFAVTYSNGHKVSFTARQCHEAANVQNHDEEQLFFVDGISVDPSVYYAEARKLCAEAWDKKAETHKRVRVLHGSSVAGYVEKWVRK
jgi:hypothetical protein